MKIEHNSRVTHWNDYSTCEIPGPLGGGHPGQVMTFKKQIIIR